MRPPHKQPFFSRSWMIALLIGAVFVALELGVKIEVESARPARPHPWLDLMLFLFAYVFAFCLKPIQAAIHRKLHRRAFRSHR